MKKVTFILSVLISITITTNAQWIGPSQIAWNNQNIYILASDGPNIFAGAGNAGIFLLTNDGNNWTAVNTGLPYNSSLCYPNLCYPNVYAFAISGVNIFAGCDSGVFLSTNNGTLWTTMSNGLPNTDIHALAISGTNIFAGTHNNGVFLSTNNGSNWTAVNTGLIGLGINALAISGTNIFAGAANNGMYLSSNNGGNWTAINNGLTNIDVHTIAISGANIFAGTSGGVFLSTNNGALWTAANTGLTNTVNCLLINGTNIFAGTDNGVFYSNNNGSSWTSISDGFPANTLVFTLAISGTNIFAGVHTDLWRRTLSEIVGISETNSDNLDFSIFPNPASDIVTLNINNLINADLSLNIYNETGSLVKSEMLKQNHRQINIGDLSNGVYMVEIKSKEWTGKQKLIIQR